MSQVSLSRPAVFVNTGRVHVWRDGTPFYVFDKPGVFTLPSGSYKMDGGALLGPMPARPGATTPRPRFPLPRKVVLKYCANPSKAQVDLRRGVVYLDHRFKNEPEFVRTFILLHEIGHYFYEDEPSCDEYAALEMYQRGYNPSQIYQAAMMSLGHHSADRIQGTFQTAKFLDNG